MKKRPREDRKSAAKDTNSKGDDAKEELDFLFDEDLSEIPQGRQNKFSSV